MQNDDEENPFHKIEELLQDIGAHFIVLNPLKLITFNGAVK